MKALLQFLLRGYLFWILFFFINRLVFAIYNYEMMDENGIGGLIPAFWYGLRLDLSLTAYLMLPPLFMYLAGLFSKGELLLQVTRFFFIICFILVSVISTADLQLYREWGMKINAQVFTYLDHPSEIIASSGSAPVGILLSLLALQILLGFVLFRYLLKPWIRAHHEYSTNEKMLQLTFSLLMSGISILLMRGGFQLSPMNQSFVYYSTSNGANQCAVNASWNLFYYLSNSGNKVDPEKYMLLEQNEADSIFSDLHQSGVLPVSDSSLPLFGRPERPNVVLVILESFTADGMAELGGENLMPELGKLAREGLLFENIYASGDRTDKGLVAILSAFPAQPVSSIITEPDRLSRLQYLPAELEKKGYQSSFIYGGESEFANMKAYLIQAGFDRIIDRADFKSSEMNSKWGAHDEAIFNKSLTYCHSSASPFFHCILTLSSHEPFDAPSFRRINAKDEAGMFRNSILYSDSCIGDYIRKASKEKWFDNTVFIFVADHGHRLIRNYDNNFNPGKFRIPLLFYGKPLSEGLKGTRRVSVGSQTDIAATLLHALMAENRFKYSHNLMAGADQGFAFYAYNDGIGWVTKNGSLCFDYVSKSVNYRSAGLNDSLEKKMLPEAQAYMQKMIQDYSSFNP